jgi:CheY-like chemotaxis protein
MPCGNPVVLVVEDDPLLRMSAVDMIESAGFDAIEAADATEAVQILERRADVRIVFTDVEMPRGINGLRLAAAIRDRWPPIQIIVTSGLVKLSAAQLPPNSLFFAKPYKEAELMAAMHRMAA